MAQGTYKSCVGLTLATIILSAYGQICWYNKTYNSIHPTLSSSTDRESNPQGAELAKICPTGNSSTLVIRCYDNNGTEFTGTKNESCQGSQGHYLLTCDTTHGGMMCNPYKGPSNCTCPDWSAQFGCECAAGVTGSPQVSPGVSALTAGPPGAGSQHRTGSSCGQHNGGDQLRAATTWTITLALLVIANIV